MNARLVSTDANVPSLPAVETVSVLAQKIQHWACASESRASWFWLDSGGYGQPRTSYLGVATEVIHADVDSEDTFIADIRKRTSGSTSSSTAFSGGWVVVLGYEYGLAGLNGRQQTLGADAKGLREPARAFALRAPAVIEISEQDTTPRLRIVDESTAQEWTEFYANIIDTPLENASPLDVTSQATWRYSDEEYEDLILRCQRLIEQGESYVMCLTNQATVTYPAEVTRQLALAAHLELRSMTMAPRAAIISTPERTLVSASPERFLTIAGDVVTTAPIKGTRPRGATPEEDEVLIQELSSDPKELAENTMIVDLLRNDLATVCVPGSIEVESLCRVETYPQVHQLVSVVSGVRESNTDVWDVLDSVFPGGSMIGTPKLRTVEWLQRLERGPRGLYSGCFGWISDDGACELSMTIRSIDFRAGWATVGAGGGITSDSVPEREIDELHLKAHVILQSLKTAMR